MKHNNAIIFIIANGFVTGWSLLPYNAFLVPQMLAEKSFRNITAFSLAKEKVFDSTYF